jgi:sugar lactone lactonase YvrE
MERIRAPELDRALAWLNTDRPLSLRELRGQLVLLDFFTYCCINCLHVLPTLRALEERHRDDPLVVIGVHSGKFDEERDPARIREALARHDVRHPVAVDDGRRLWHAYTIRAWPTLVLVRPDGTIAWTASGEPDPAQLEARIAEELAAARRAGTLGPPSPVRRAPPMAEGFLRYPGKVAVAPDGRLAVADSGHHRVVVATPEGRVLTVVGSGRRGLADGAFEDAAFDDPQGLCWDGEQLWLADTQNHALRRIDLMTRTVETVGGTGRLGGARFPVGPAPARSVDLRSPWDVVREGQTLYVAMAGTHQIWALDLAVGTLGPWAGLGAEALIDGSCSGGSCSGGSCSEDAGSEGSRSGAGRSGASRPEPLAEAAFAQPSGLALGQDQDGQRWLYVADAESSAVRAIALGPGPAAGQVTTLVGEGLFDFGDVDGPGGPGGPARLQHCLGVAAGPGGLVVADTYNHKIKRIAPLHLGEARAAPEVSTIYTGACALALAEPGGLAWAPDGSLVVADTNHHRLLRLRFTAAGVSAVVIELRAAS